MINLSNNSKTSLADDIKIDLVEIEWGDVEWIVLDQYRDNWRALVQAVMNLRVL
jgi:hypothetical protein